MVQEILKELLESYKVSNHITEPELIVVNSFFQLMNEKEYCFNREDGGHITASAWIINPEKNAALFTHHKKLNKWFQLGGHCDGDFDVKAVALREAQEEAGIQDFSFLIPGIFDIDIHPIPNACEYHYDVRFLLHAHNNDFVVSEESHNLAWVAFEDIHSFVQEASVLRMNRKYMNL